MTVLPVACLCLAMAIPVQATTGALSMEGTRDGGARTDEYDIFRNERRVGQHTVNRFMEDGKLVVDVSTRIRVTLLGIEFYRFEYDAREEWDEQGLSSLQVSVNDDGEPVRLDGRRVGNEFRWTRDRESGASAMPVFPTNHWNAKVLGHDRVLNTLTGKMNRVQITRDGPDVSVSTIGINKSTALRYRYEGDLQLVSWYSDTGDWLAMRFVADDGSVIDYRCRLCARAGGE